jgi:hypothetical protein
MARPSGAKAEALLLGTFVAVFALSLAGCAGGRATSTTLPLRLGPYEHRGDLRPARVTDGVDSSGMIVAERAGGLRTTRCGAGDHATYAGEVSGGGARCLP